MTRKARLGMVCAVLGSIMLLSLLLPGRVRSTVDAYAERVGTALQASAMTPTTAGYLPVVIRDNPLTPNPSATLTPNPSATLTPSPSATATPSPSATATPPGSIPAFRHVFIIMMENEAYEQIIGNTSSAPYLNSLAQQYVTATNYYGVRHPSLPNYIALIGGDTFGITTNCTTCFINAPNLVDQLESAGKSWKAYMEDMPSPCFLGDAGTLYRQKHNPFIYFDDIRQNSARCNKIVPFTEFDADLQAGTLPDYSWITPNMCHSIHDCPLRDGDAWLQTWVTKIMASPAWQQDGVLFITWDESASADTSGCCQYAVGGHILTLVISPLGRPAYQSPVAYDHYSLLATIEDAWGLPRLGKASCACSPSLADFFTPPATALRR